MLGLKLEVPIASWRRGAAREFLETEPLPPPSTCYGALLSLVGEEDADRHRGCRVTAGLVGTPAKSTVFRSLWQVKDRATPRGNKTNIGPDLQELLTGITLVLWCDSGEEPRSDNTLESRVQEALRAPAGVRRFGGWALGESTHLIDSADLLPDGRLPGECRAFLLDAGGPLTLPVWVDHVGSKGTRFAVGRLESIRTWPSVDRLPRIPPP